LRSLLVIVASSKEEFVVVRVEELKKPLSDLPVDGRDLVCGHWRPGPYLRLDAPGERAHYCGRASTVASKPRVSLPRRPSFAVGSYWRVGAGRSERDERNRSGAEIQKAPKPLPGPAPFTFRSTKEGRAENAPQTKHPWFPGRKPGRRLSEFKLSVGRSGEIR